MKTNRITPGLRTPYGPSARPPRVPLDAALMVLRYLRPFAAPRLPADVLACFDEQQRQIRPLPEQVRERGRPTRKAPPGIPAQRQPHPSEQGGRRASR